MALAQEEKKPERAPAQSLVTGHLGKVPSMGCFLLGTRVRGQALGQDWSVPGAGGTFPQPFPQLSLGVPPVLCPRHSLVTLVLALRLVSGITEWSHVSTQVDLASLKGVNEHL